MGRLETKRAVITGGGSGLGAAIARRFAEEGAAVTLIDLARMADRANDLVAELRATANTALFLCSDEAAMFTDSILHPDGGMTSATGGG